MPLPVACQRRPASTPPTLSLFDRFLHRRPALDDYGAESPAELFAVAVESFFETPDELRRQYPALHAHLEALLGGRVQERCEPGDWSWEGCAVLVKRKEVARPMQDPDSMVVSQNVCLR